MLKKMNSLHPSKSAILAVLGVALFLAMAFLKILKPEWTWGPILFGVLLVADIVALLYQNRKSLQSRAAAYGLNTVVTIILVISLIGVVNFLAEKNPLKLDLTKNQRHTLSEQTLKVLKGLQKDVHATFYATLESQSEFRPLLDNYEQSSSKFSIEYVNPIKNRLRAEQDDVRKDGTLILASEGHKQKIDKLSEQSITNKLILLTKDKSQTLCAITGHGEKDLQNSEAIGYSSVRAGLERQKYQVKEVNLAQEEKIPLECDAIGIFGPKSAYFKREVDMIDHYLENGGRGVFAFDLNIKKGEPVPELFQLLKKWYVDVQDAMIIDPLSKLANQDFTVPLVSNYSRRNAITKDFDDPRVYSTFLPFVRPVEPMDKPPAGIKVEWLAKTQPTAWAETNLKMLATGKVKPDKEDRRGSISTAVAVSGKQKDADAKEKTRIVVFGTSLFASNNLARFGANLDFFLNSVSWLMEDENLIAIRPKKEEAGKIELTSKQASMTFFIAVILMPLTIVGAGIVNWLRRRKL